METFWTIYEFLNIYKHSEKMPRFMQNNSKNIQTIHTGKTHEIKYLKNNETSNLTHN